MPGIYELKASLQNVGAQLKKVNDDLMTKAGDPNVPLEDITALENQKAQLQTRFNILQAEHTELEAKQKEDLERSLKNTISNVSSAQSDAARIVAAKAEFIRATVEGREIAPDAKEVLAELAEPPLRAIPSGSNTTTGQNLLPTNLSNQVISEPFVKNPLRGRIGMSAIKGLELPKIAFEIDNDGFITDEGTAREIAASGDKVSFGKNKFKVKVRIQDTVLHGSDIDLVNYVETALQSGLAAKERKVSFAHGSTPGTDPLPVVAAEKHMSLYEVDGSGDSVIKEVTGADMYEAITNAIADLHEDFREGATVCMRYADYVTMLKDLSNHDIALYGKQPEEIIGKPVFFTDAAAVYDTDAICGRPIVGNFSYLHLNYDPETVYDSDKDVDKGEYIWVLTAWFDQRKKLNSAFRIAKAVVPEA